MLSLMSSSRLPTETQGIFGALCLWCWVRAFYFLSYRCLACIIWLLDLCFMEFLCIQTCRSLHPELVIGKGSCLSPWKQTASPASRPHRDRHQFKADNHPRAHSGPTSIGPLGTMSLISVYKYQLVLLQELPGLEHSFTPCKPLTVICTW